jgi:hypothetical protein
MKIAFSQNCLMTNMFEERTMLNIRTLTLAAFLAASSLPALAAPVWIYASTDDTAGPLGQTWSGSWADGWDVYEWFSDLTIGAKTLSYDFQVVGGWAGSPTQTYVFSTAAAQAGALSLDIGLSSNAAWNGSATGMYIWQGDTSHAQLLAGATGDAVVHRNVTLDLDQGQAWGFMAVSGSTDSDNFALNGPIHGAFTVTDASTGGTVPEPAPLALLGLGALGLAAFRRKV